MYAGGLNGSVTIAVRGPVQDCSRMATDRPAMVKLSKSFPDIITSVLSAIRKELGIVYENEMPPTFGDLPCIRQPNPLSRTGCFLILENIIGEGCDRIGHKGGQGGDFSTSPEKEGMVWRRE